MSSLLAHVTAMDSVMILAVFALGCVVGGSTVLSCLRRRSPNADR